MEILYLIIMMALAMVFSLAVSNAVTVLARYLARRYIASILARNIGHKKEKP